MNKRLSIIIYLVSLVFILIFFVFSDFGLIKRIELSKQKKELLEAKQKEDFIRDSLLKEKSRLFKDSTEIERIAREYYGYISTGETVYIISKSK